MKHQKGSVGTVILIVIVVVVAVGGYMLYQRNKDNAGTQKENTFTTEAEGSSVSRRDTLAGLPYEEAARKAKEIALSIVKEESIGRADCPKTSTDIISTQEDGIEKAWGIFVFYENCKDDSIEAIREERLMTFKEELGWELRDPHTSYQRCQEGRGHQDFSNKPCL
ncbi:MAG: hypothetical protein AAB649_02215 [Patescibacteria group bacterium]